MSDASAPAEAREVPRLVLLQPDPDARKTWVTTLSDGGHLEVEGASDPVELLEHLSNTERPLAGLLLPWPDHAFDPTEFFALIRKADVPDPPFVLALAPDWPKTIAARASRLGVHAFLTPPLMLRDVVTDLVSLRRTGRSASAAKHLGRSGVDDPGWRARMVSLASTVPRAGAKKKWEKRINKLLAALDADNGKPLDLGTVEALVLFARGDQRQLDMGLMGNDEVSLEQLEQLYQVVEKTAGASASSPGAQARIVRIVEAVVAQVARRDNLAGASEGFRKLRESGSILLTHTRDEATDEQSTDLSTFRFRLSQALEVALECLKPLRPPRLRRIAAHVVRSTNEERAMDYARLMVLAALLKKKRQGDDDDEQEVDYDVLAGVSGVLGVKGHEEADIADRLRTLSDELEGQGDPTGAELPNFSSFQAMFCDLAARADPAVLAKMGLDSRALERSLSAMAPPPAAESTTEVAVKPSSMSLLGRLSTELGISMELLERFDSPDLIERLPRIKLDGITLASGALARVRLVALLIHECEDPQESMVLMDAFTTKYVRRADMLGAIVQTLKSVGSPGAAEQVNKLVIGSA